MKISIAMATYNGGEFLAEQLDCLARQTLPPFEIVVCDDGSTDRTIDMLLAFARSSGLPVRIHRNDQNLGYRKNFLKTALLCSGDAVAFCDQDDIWLPEKLAICAAALSDPDISLVIHSGEVVDRELKPVGRRNPAYRRRQKAQRLHHDFWAPRPGYAQVFRRTLIDGLNIEDLPHDRYDSSFRMAHDHVIYLLGNASGALFLPDNLVRYRQHGNNVFGVRRKNWLMNSFVCQLADPSGSYAWLAVLSAEYSDLLATLAKTRSDEIGRRFHEAAAKFRSRGDTYGRRSKLYAANGVITTLSGVVRIAVECWRASKRGTVERNAFLKDLVYGGTGGLLSHVNDRFLAFVRNLRN